MYHHELLAAEIEGVSWKQDGEKPFKAESTLHGEAAPSVWLRNDVTELLVEVFFSRVLNKNSVSDI